METRDELLKKAERYASDYRRTARAERFSDREAAKLAQMTDDLHKAVDYLIQAMKADPGE